MVGHGGSCCNRKCKTIIIAPFSLRCACNKEGDWKQLEGCRSEQRFYSKLTPAQPYEKLPLFLEKIEVVEILKTVNFEI